MGDKLKGEKTVTLLCCWWHLKKNTIILEQRIPANQYDIFRTDQLLLIDGSVSLSTTIILKPIKTEISFENNDVYPSRESESMCIEAILVVQYGLTHY